MAEAYVVNPDTGFIDRLLKEGGQDLKKCFQCATCSVVCELADGDGAPFPRKEMIWAQWGLKDRLMADPDVWRCHQCNDCSTHCPRGARPGDVLAAVRQETVRHYAVPQFLGGWVSRAGMLPVLLLIPALLLLIAMSVQPALWQAGEGALQYLHHEGFYADLFPHWLLIGFYTFFWSLSLLGALVGVTRFWGDMKSADVAAGRETGVVGVLPSFIRTVKSILVHDRFGKCTSRSTRRTAHLGAFYGFLALFLVSVWAVIALYMINPLIPGHDQDLIYPFAIWNPWKILANLGGVGLVVGCVLAIRDRKGGSDEAPSSSAFDWAFLYLLLIVGVTGLLTEIMRYVAEPAGTQALVYVAYTIYFVHLVVVFDLLVLLPHSKFAHVMYRTVAMVYAEYSGRSRAALAPRT
jgi:quinone-modifying oxidoreductase, subunit QmoC